MAPRPEVRVRNHTLNNTIYFREDGRNSPQLPLDRTKSSPL